MIRVYYTQAQVENIGPDSLENRSRTAVEELPSVKRAQILRLRPPLSRFISALGWQLVKFAFKRSGHADFELSQLQFDERKKPRWSDGTPDFNLSHSGSLLACALTDEGLVGIDVELIRPLEDAGRMFERILAPEETLPSDGGPALFFQYWTRKEAVIKAEGGGGGGVWNMPHIHLQATKADYRNLSWHLYPLELVPGYAACLVSDRSNQDIRIEAVACEQLLLP